MISTTRRRPDAADLIALTTIVVGFVVLLALGRGLTFFADEWAVIGDRPIGIDTFFRPFNEHWLGVMTLVHRAMVETIGLGTYMPYLAVLAALHAVVVAEVYVIARRGTWPLLAAGIAVIVAFFGSGFENLFWAMQIGFVGSVAMGFGSLLLLDGRPTRGRVAGAVALSTLSIATSGFGLFMLALVGLDLLCDPRRRRLALAMVVPAGVYAGWYLAFGRAGLATYGDPFTLGRLVAIPLFTLDGTAEAFSSATGSGRELGRVIVLALAGWLAFRAIRRQPIPPRALAFFGAIVVEYGLLSLVRAQLDVDATYYSRYSYLSGIFALLGIAELIGRRPVPADPRVRFVAVAAVASVFVLSLTLNVSLLLGGRELFAQRAEMTRALVQLGTTMPLPPGVNPDLSLVLVPSPVRLDRIVAQYGSPLHDSLAGDVVPAIPAIVQADALDRATHPPAWLLAAPDSF